MAKKVGSNLDLNKNKLQNAVIDPLAADPSSPVQGQIYFNTVTAKQRTYNGQSWDEETPSLGAMMMIQKANYWFSY